MNWKFEFIEDQQYIRVVSEGVFSADEQLRLTKDLISQPYWRKGMPVFFDNRKLDYSAGGTSAIRETSANHIEMNERIGNGKAALLMKSVSDFGLGVNMSS